ncbi:sortase [Candidatus Saccharibacteria bacterium]|nr:sortase [Candidatus Saccharibacteria bacterium]
MADNPLFSNDNQQDAGHLMPGKGHAVQPLSDEEKASISANPAADLIREKLAKIYATEPDTLKEEQEVQAVKHRSKHQQFMYDLSTSGKGLAEIQTEWHNYYVALPDDEKHRVWQEFYENNQPTKQPALHEPAPKKGREIMTAPRERQVVAADLAPETDSKRSSSAVRKHIRNQVDKRTANMSHTTRQHFKSLFFGLSVGVIVLLIMLFGFFNEVIIAPFIQPGRANATPIIVNTDSVDASADPQVIIPKINVQIPVVYDLKSNDEAVVQKGLERGVVHYPTTVKPGELGNAAFFGHSSNNIFNSGKYKFAFVLLHKLTEGDVFYLTYEGTIYSYKVISTRIVSPSEISVLDDIPGESATATLITCDPPGTSLHRLVVVGRQISPNPSGNSTPSDSTTISNEALPGNGPTMWTRIWRSVF